MEVKVEIEVIASTPVDSVPEGVWFERGGPRFKPQIAKKASNVHLKRVAALASPDSVRRVCVLQRMFYIRYLR